LLILIGVRLNSNSRFAIRNLVQGPEIGWIEEMTALWES
jgi:hypothetical protein